jgi:hypothetical protein
MLVGAERNDVLVVDGAEKRMELLCDLIGNQCRLSAWRTLTRAGPLLGLTIDNMGLFLEQNN